MRRHPRTAIVGVLLLAAACGSSGAADPTAVPQGSTAFVMTIEVLPHDGGDPRPVGRLEGVTTVDPPRVELSGVVQGGPVTLARDGNRWSDLADPGAELTEEDVAAYLAGSGFLRPEDVAPLLTDEQEWEAVGDDEHLGVPVTHLRRVGVEGDAEWSYGDLAVIDVWQDEGGDLVKIVAQWATGDNEGFPVSTWELVEHEPDVTSAVPGN